MSILKLKGNASGTGTVTLEAPNTNTDQTIAIPDGAGSFVTANASGDVAVTGTFTSQGIDDNATSTAITLDSSGNVGIGTANIYNPLQVNVTESTSSKTSGSAFDGAAIRIDGALATVSGEVALLMGSNDGLSSAIGTMRESSSTWGTALKFYTHTSAITTVDELTERARLTSDGSFLVGTSSGSARINSYYAGGTAYSAKINASGSGMEVSSEGLSNTMTALSFRTNYGAVGSITCGSSTAYNTTSDYRLKENVVDLTGASDRINQIPVHRFNFIADPDRTVDGFLAHEVQDIVPEAITGTKDAMRDEEYEVTPAVLDDDGNVVTEAVMGTRSVPDYQGIDQSKLVPLLTAALQEALAKIETLETEMTSVKARLDALEAV